MTIKSNFESKLHTLAVYVTIMSAAPTKHGERTDGGLFRFRRGKHRRPEHAPRWRRPRRKPALSLGGTCRPWRVRLPQGDDQQHNLDLCGRTIETTVLHLYVASKNEIRNIMAQLKYCYEILSVECGVSSKIYIISNCLKYETQNTELVWFSFSFAFSFNNYFRHYLPHIRLLVIKLKKDSHLCDFLNF